MCWVLHPAFLTPTPGVPCHLWCHDVPWLIWLKVRCIPARLMVSGQPALARETSSISCTSHPWLSPIGRKQPVLPGVDVPSSLEQNAEGLERDWMASGLSKQERQLISPLKDRKGGLPCTSKSSLWHISGFL